jgi:hypothetical protein
MNLDALIACDCKRAADYLRRGAEVLEMVSIEAGPDFDRVCADAGIPASLARDAIAWVSKPAIIQPSSSPNILR